MQPVMPTARDFDRSGLPGSSRLAASVFSRLRPEPIDPIEICPILSAFLFAGFTLCGLVCVPSAFPQRPPQPSTTHTASSPAALYRIAGTIVNADSGEPVRRASVAVLSEQDSHTIAAVESDEEGRFSLDLLPAAKYQLTASKRGFRTAFYDEHQEFSSAVVTGPDQQTDKLTFRLVPGVILHGIITTEGGDPVENARVMLFQKSASGKPGGSLLQSGTASTDDTGAYEFSSLAAGEYRLAVLAEPWYALHRATHNRAPGAAAVDTLGAADPAAALDVAYPTTYFDSTTEEASATPLALAGGARVEADLTLHAVPALHIEIEAPRRQDGMIAPAELRQTVFGNVIGAVSGGVQDAAPSGATIEFNGVAPGHYELAQGDPPRVVEMDATANLEVDPSLGVATTAVRGTLRTPAGSGFAEDCNLTLDPVDAPDRQRPVQSVCLNGAFTFPSVPPGRWQLSAERAGSEFSIASITEGSRTRAGGLISVADRPLSLIVSLVPGSTRVEGFARRDGKGVAGLMVVLVPRDLSAISALARRDQSDSDGSFALRNVLAGQYTVVAIEDGWKIDWAEPAVIARYLPGGLAVTVSDNPGKLLTIAPPLPVQSAQAGP
jgi:5-hydroxyisourate hydrolase-like protein (transthyretin family)